MNVNNVNRSTSIRSKSQMISQQIDTDVVDNADAQMSCSFRRPSDFAQVCLC